MNTELGKDEQRFITYGAGGELPEMTPFVCPSCDNHVLVRKNGPAQTSVQWIETLQCPLLLAASAETELGLIRSCHTLNDAIDAAVLAGEIPFSAQSELNEGQEKNERD